MLHVCAALGEGSASAETPAVLLVNDEPAQLVAMEAILSASGYRVVPAGSGREALRRLLADDFAVVVLDVRMPDLDGFETAELIRQRPRSASTPIIFATAQAVSPDDARRGYTLGAVEYLVAPFDAAALRAKVAVFVDLHEKAAALAVRAEELRRANERLEREVIERRRAEAALANKALQLEAAVHDLASYDYSVAHDLRAPLRAINSFTSIVVEDEGEGLSEPSRGHLARVLAATHRMSSLIDGLLALSRASRAPIALADADVSAIATEICAELAHTHPGRRVEATIQPGLRARADPTLLRVALQNLLENAWKFTRTREVAHVEVGVEDGTFFVRDDGVGFDTKFAGQLFQAFHQLHGQEYEGTGVGLATVRRIVERHGGRVWAGSAPDRGTAFHFTLERAGEGGGLGP